MRSLLLLALFSLAACGSKQADLLGPGNEGDKPGANNPRGDWGPEPHQSRASEGATGDEVVLSLDAVCTAMGCAEPQPCCNACGFQGWLQGSVKARSETTPLPQCDVDGCGKCAFQLFARGRVEGNEFVVTSWRKSD